VGECLFWYRPTRVVPDQRPLNGRCCLLLFFDRDGTLRGNNSYRQARPLYRHEGYAYYLQSTVPTFDLLGLVCALLWGGSGHQTVDGRYAHATLDGSAIRAG